MELNHNYYNFISGLQCKILLNLTFSNPKTYRLFKALTIFQISKLLTILAIIHLIIKRIVTEMKMKRKI